MPTDSLFTIGYEKRSFDEFLAVLKAAGIDVVIDVRETAWTRKHGFSKSGLTTGLAAAGIEYVHARFAGNPKRLRAAATDHAEIVAKYREHLSASPRILDELDQLIDGYLAAGKKVALTCYERHPDDCHRGVLAEAWRERRHGHVVHLEPDGCVRLIGSMPLTP
jgi:uncharacterized protein (DUF488 family)